MTDILNPPKEDVLAQGRKIPSIGSATSESMTPPQGQPMPIPANPEQMQPQGNPMPMPATSEQGQPMEEEYGQNVFTPEMNPQNIRYSPIETPLPSFNGIDALQEASSTPMQVQAQVEQTQAQLSPDNIREVMGMIRPQPIEWSGKFESDSQEVRDRLVQLQYENRKLIEQNDLGLQNAQFSNTGERSYGVSAVDNGVAARGMLSGIGKDLQDTDDPSRENNTSNRILGWLDRAGRTAGSVLAKTFGYIGGGLALDVGGAVQKKPEALARNAEILEGMDANKMGLANLAPVANEQGKYHINPTKGQWGDYGDHPVLSPILYAANLPQAVLNGLIYDAADLIHGDKGKSDKERSRTLQALQGRDYGASNRWSEDKYLSLQEPENFVSGKLARDDDKYKQNPMADYWDFPEWFEKTPVGKVIPGNEKTNHLLFQTLPALAAEVVTGGLSDWGVSSLVSTARNARKVAKVADAVQETSGAIVKVESESVVPFYETTRVTTTVRTRPAAALEPTGRVMSQRALPPGERISSRISRNNILSEGDLTLNVRSNNELSVLARNTINPVSGKPISKTDRVLSDLEVARLQQQYGNLFDRYGKEIPDIEGSKYIERADGTVGEIVHNPLTIDVPTISNYGDTAKVIQEVDDLGGQLRYALETGQSNTDSIVARIIKADEKMQRAIANTPEEQLYQAYTNKLPNSLITDDQAGVQVGNELIKHQHMLDAQRPVLDQLTEEVDNLKVRVNETMDELNTLPDYKRANIEDSLNTKEMFNPGSVPEVRVQPYNPKLIPPIEELPIRARGLDNTLDETPLWLHGSASSVGIRERDILNGATPSEFGLGTYLTTSQDVADQAAYALRQSNRPPRPDSVEGAPYRTTVDTTRLTKVLNLNDAPGVDVQNIFAKARKSVGLDGFDNTSKRVADMWNQFDVDYANKFNGKVSESVKREFQQKVLLNLQQFGYDGGIFYKNYKKLEESINTPQQVTNRLAAAVEKFRGQYEDYVPIHELRKELGDVSREEFDKAVMKLSKDEAVEMSTMATPTSYTPDQLAAGIPQPVGGSMFFFVPQEGLSKYLNTTNVGKKSTQDLNDAILVNYQPHKLGVVGSNTPLDTPGITKQLEARKWLDQKTFETLPNDVTRSYHLQSKLQFESKVLQDTSEVLVKEQFKQGEIMENLSKLETELEGITYRQKENLLRTEPEMPKLDVQKQIRENDTPCIKVSRGMKGTNKFFDGLK